MPRSSCRAWAFPSTAKLGDYQTEPKNGVRIALHGGVGNIDGSYNSLTMRSGLTATGYNGVHWGESYIQTVSFDDQGPVAQAMLTYGQSTDPEVAVLRGPDRRVFAQGVAGLALYAKRRSRPIRTTRP